LKEIRGFTNLSINKKPSLNLLEDIRSLVAVRTSHFELVRVEAVQKERGMKLSSGEEIELNILGMPPMASVDITKHGWRNGVSVLFMQPP